MKRIALIILLLCISAVPCFAGSKAKNEVNKGNLLYNKGKFLEALKQYEEALLRDPDSDVVNFDLGGALYKTEDYKKAITHMEKSLVSGDKSLEQSANYNVGNAKYKYGISQESTDVNSAVDLLKQSLRHYQRAIELDPKDEDAKYNYEFVKKELQRLEEKQQKQQSQENQQSQQGGKQDQQQKQEQQQKQSQQQGESQKQEGQSQEQQSQEQQSLQEQSQQEQQPQDSAAPEEKQDEQEGSQQPLEAKESAGQMSEQEAQMLLDGYRHEEEPQGLLKGKVPTRNLPEASKDW